MRTVASRAGVAPRSPACAGYASVAATIAYGREDSGHRAAGRPVPRQTQMYEVHDAALGPLERGHVKVRDMVTRQPWPTDGPDHPGYVVWSPHLLRPVSDADGSVEGPSPMGTAS
ncbi:MULTISPECIES: DUF3556 domain-containing protein [unclassified Streptomyces]|uniref:DUF3556 domain-containing protein n=1 Tax=unclassified Streptomyces TaxID=2593676 RepID=UPI003865FACE